MSTIVTRAGKGSPLTNTEMDSNLTNLNTDKYQSGDSPTFTSVTTPIVTSAASTALTLKSAGTTAITVDTSQNVNLASKLSFSYNTGYYNQDNAISNYASGNYLYVSGNGTSTGGLYLQGAGNQKQRIIIDGNSAGGSIAFGTNGSEAARIDSSGNLLVNTTSATGASKFVVAADTTSVNPMTVSNTRSTAATDYSILFYRNGSIVGSVQTTLSATSFVTSSDYRLKEDIQPMTGALAKVAQLNPVTYKWKLDGTEAQGFIAHELQAVVPDCVTGTKDELDADGNPKYQGIDTSFLVATLTAAIQELKAELDELKAKVNA